MLMKECKYWCDAALAHYKAEGKAIKVYDANVCECDTLYGIDDNIYTVDEFIAKFRKDVPDFDVFDERLDDPDPITHAYTLKLTEKEVQRLISLLIDNAVDDTDGSYTGATGHMLSQLNRAVNTADVCTLLYMNVYESTRVYGGPEEGGWWYTRNECVYTFASSDECSIMTECSVQCDLYNVDPGLIDPDTETLIADAMDDILIGKRTLVLVDDYDEHAMAGLQIMLEAAPACSDNTHEHHYYC